MNKIHRLVIQLKTSSSDAAISCYFALDCSHPLKTEEYGNTISAYHIEAGIRTVISLIFHFMIRTWTMDLILSLM